MYINTIYPPPIVEILILFAAFAKGYTKVEKKHCNNDKYGSYETLNDAKSACTSDENCSGVYGYGCDNAYRFYLCPSTSAAETSSSSCIYVKKGRQPHGGRFLWTGR